MWSMTFSKCTKNDGHRVGTASVGYYTETIQEVLKQTQTVDAVEVVRCVRCANRTNSKWCNLKMMDVKDNWFRSHGAKKQEV